MSGLGISGLKSRIANQPVIDLECGVTYEEWEETVPEVITGDPVWKFFAYRKALPIARRCSCTIWHGGTATS